MNSSSSAGTRALAVLIAICLILVSFAVAPGHLWRFEAALAKPSDSLKPEGGRALESREVELYGVFKVPLVTGDIVYVANTSKGLRVVSVEPADPLRKGQGFRILELDEHVYVIPSYVDLRKYDLSLFDVAYLVRENYGNLTRYPIIVKAPSEEAAVSIAANVSRIAGGKGAIASRALNLVALRVPNQKDSLRRLFREVLEIGNVERVWLDRKVYAKLDVSAPLVGALEAWNLGYNGSGVKIAILDTGIDPTHPDFTFPNGTSKVLLEKSFVDYYGDGLPDEDPYDYHGHGTHVASIAAGTGLASGGRFTGIAPGAWLLNGKVLNRYGVGFMSWIISGIEWAVESGADVISMSLGGGFTDGTDPLSMACNWAVSQGVMVVAAAGNEGWWGYFTVTAPGTASEVITVGASDKGDEIAGFSSRGPTIDLRIKPEIVAPGVDIWAALAKDSLIEEWANTGWIPGIDTDGDGRYDYVALSGTSMATPHVSGAVAVLLQRFPSLKPSDVKNLLISTAELLPGYNIYEQGAGRLSVSRAINPVLYLDPAAISLKIPAVSIVNTTITLVSLLDRNITLAFSVSAASLSNAGLGIPGNAFYIANETVILPAGGTAKVVFVANFTALPRTDFWGVIYVLNASDGSALAHGVFSAFRWYKLTVKKIDIYGEPSPYDLITIVPYNRTALVQLYTGFTNASGVLEVYLPEGLYIVETARYDDSTGRTYFIAKEVQLTSDAEVVLDERETHEVMLAGTQGQTPIEKSVTAYVLTPWLGYSHTWIIWYPHTTCDNIFTPYPADVRYKLVPSNWVNPSAPDVIDSPVLFAPVAVFSNVTAPKTLYPNYEITVNAEYRTYATPKVSVETAFHHLFAAEYGGLGYGYFSISFMYRVNAPKRLQIRVNPYWENVNARWADFWIVAWKSEDMPGVRTPYWEYFGWIPLLDLHAAGMYNLALYLAAEPEYRLASAWFSLNGTLKELGFEGWMAVGLNSSYVEWFGDPVYWDVKVLVNGTDIADLAAQHYGGFVRVWATNLNFSLPAKVEVYHNFTRDHTLSTSVSSRNVYIVEEWGNGTYWAEPLRVELIDAELDANNTLTAVKPAKVVIAVASNYDLTHVVLRYRVDGTWYDSTLVSGTGFGYGYNVYVFALNYLKNGTFVDLSIYLRDVKGNELEQNITRAFYVNVVYPPDTVPPTVSVTHSPERPTTAQAVMFTVTVSDEGSGVVYVALYVDGNLVQTWNASGTYTYVGGPYPAGIRTYYAVAVDAAGNEALTDTRAFVVIPIDVIITVRGMDDAIYFNIYGNGYWKGWVKLKIGRTVDVPAVAFVNGELHIVVRGSDGASIWHCVVDPSTGEFKKPWTRIPGSTPSRSALAPAPDGKLYLVVRGGNNRIYYNVYSNGSWLGWKALPSGSTIDAPAAAVLGNALHIVVRGSDGASIWHSWIDPSTGEFSGWRRLPGSTPSAPYMTSDGVKLYLAVRGGDDRIYINSFYEDWEGWRAIPSGRTPGTPAVAVYGRFLHVYVVGFDVGIYRTTMDLYTGKFARWERVSGSTSSPPALTSGRQP